VSGELWDVDIRWGWGEDDEYRWNDVQCEY
jgi:hypothetical protein